jgi:uncharacterized membrane protein YphA (DoxX/SURF4 family)
MVARLFDSDWLHLSARLLLGSIFIYASWDKLFHPLEFARIIAAYQILPERVVGLVAAVLPFLELICGILLITGFWPLPCLLCVGSLLIIFMAALIQASLRGLAIDCGCFVTSGANDKAGLKTILRDSIILLLWMKLFWYYRSREIPLRKEIADAI